MSPNIVVDWKQIKKFKPNMCSNPLISASIGIIVFVNYGVIAFYQSLHYGTEIKNVYRQTMDKKSFRNLKLTYYYFNR